ncbi:hypothetical protein SAMN05216403_10878 [Nitrosospira multiformis ATCC 25196]|uniref:Uncharacterized protein n=1 Tax=Nitrosospira multiformis (strain ATCC 25196 / NCIMB 11849 / C 71) TaxID=323848 RepID=A0A1H5UNL2_NITMU|nr:hypothetical protein SAMN05216411_106146 [Nitrosospira multiformis]SEF76639.1 hypothetical protein SAMN05216403_10878 [Nitrosospira multiformis ATCC 25196]
MLPGSRLSSPFQVYNRREITQKKYSTGAATGKNEPGYFTGLPANGARCFGSRFAYPPPLVNIGAIDMKRGDVKTPQNTPQCL